MNDNDTPLGEGWWLQAECRGLTTAERDDIFFPDRGAPTKTAKAICKVCPVREDCLKHALDNNERFGIWGGLSERERRRIRRARNIAGTVAS